MTQWGLLDESMARKEIEKLMLLLKMQRDLKNKVPSSEMEKACLPIQKDAVGKEIRRIVEYLRKWHVNIKAVIKNGVSN
jgi:hypothetical protein